MYIEKAELFPLQIPMKGIFKTSRGKIGGGSMKRNVVMVRLTDDEGHVGWGEGSPSHIWSSETMETVVWTLRNHYFPAIIGLPVANLSGLHDAMNKVIAPSFSTSHPIAKSAVDIAVHDLLAHSRGIRVMDLWGYSRSDSITLSWTVSASDLQEVEESVKEGLEKGYSHFNCKLGINSKFDIEQCEIIKNLVPDGFLWGDANGGYTANEIIRISSDLEKSGLDFLEQPLPSNQLFHMKELKKRLSIPLGVDEPIVSPTDLMEWVRLDLISAHVAKVTRTGGLFPSRICMEMAENAGMLTICSGLTESGLGLAANLQLACAFGITLPCAWNGPQFLEGDVLIEPLIVKGGKINLPDGHGLGVKVDIEKVEFYTIDV